VAGRIWYWVGLAALISSNPTVGLDVLQKIRVRTLIISMDFVKPVAIAKKTPGNSL
jgi:hypothetical protein